MRLLRIPEAFDHPDFVFEPKIDGFRALAHIEGHRCTLVSRNGYVFKSWPQLGEEIAHAVRADQAVIDGEICCLDPDGRSNFNKLLFRRDWPYFYAFDLVSLNGQDLRALPLLERKRRLRDVLPRIESRILYLDHLAKRGIDFYDAACRRDLEGIVAKLAHGSYQIDLLSCVDKRDTDRLKPPCKCIPVGKPILDQSQQHFVLDGRFQRPGVVQVREQPVLDALVDYDLSVLPDGNVCLND